MKRMACVLALATAGTGMATGMAARHALAATARASFIGGLQVEILTPDSVPADGAVNLDVKFHGGNLRSVELYLDGALVKKQNVLTRTGQGTIRFNIDSAVLADGSHEVRIVATDTNGSTAATSSQINVAPPTLNTGARIQLPRNHSQVEGIVPIVVNLSSSIRKPYVMYFVDNEFLALINYPPYTYNWDTSTLSNGPHTLGVEAYDSDTMAKVKAQEYNVRVNNAGGFRPLEHEAPAPVADAVPNPAEALLTMPASALEMVIAGSQLQRLALNPQHRDRMSSVRPNSAPAVAAPINSFAPRSMVPSVPKMTAASVLPGQTPQAQMGSVGVIGMPVRPLVNVTVVNHEPSAFMLRTARTPAQTAGPSMGRYAASAERMAQTMLQLSGITVSMRPAVPTVSHRVGTAARPAVAEAAAPRMFALPFGDMSGVHGMTAQPHLQTNEAVRPALAANLNGAPTGHPVRVVKPGPFLDLAGIAALAAPRAAALPSPSGIAQLRVRPMRVGNVAVQPSGVFRATPISALRPVVHLGHPMHAGAPLLRVPRSGFRVAFDNQMIAFDVAPRVQHGLPLAPFRPIFEHTGGTVSWFQRAHVVRAVNSEREVEIHIGDTNAKVNNQPVVMEAKPYVDHGRTIVPLSFIRDALNVKVTYDEATGHLLIERKK